MNTPAFLPKHTTLTNRLVTVPAPAPTGMCLMSPALGYKPCPPWHLPRQSHPHSADTPTDRLPQQLFKQVNFHCNSTCSWWNQHIHKAPRSSPCSCISLVTKQCEDPVNTSHHISQQLWGLPGVALQQTVIDQVQTYLDEFLETLSGMLVPSEEDLGLWYFIA